MNRFFRAILCILICVGFYFEAYSQNTNWNGFTDINWKYDDIEDINSFNLGELTTFITSDITDNISFLNENTFSIYSGEEIDFEVAVERVIIKYQVDNYLNFLIGKHHTAISYWNDAYHHGRVLQPSATRPLYFTKGLFPIHTTGFIVGGNYIGDQNFGYKVMVGNGIGSTPFKDNDKNKSLLLSTFIEPNDGIKIMVSSYFDKISKGVANFQDTLLSEHVLQSLYSASLRFEPTDMNVEMLSEFMWAKNKTNATGKTNNVSAYLHIGYSIEKFTPYYRFDILRIDGNDPYYEINNQETHNIGVRYSFSYLANLKLEYELMRSDMVGKRNMLILQFGIGF